MENQLSMSGQFLANIDKIIEENLANENFSVEDLAQYVGLSRSMLHRKLIKLTGKSASDIITEKRLLRAKQLLENDVATASEIAYQVGFNSPSYFNKVFRKHFNVSPGEMRKGATITINKPYVEQEHERKVLSPSKKSALKFKILIVIFITVIIGAGFYVFSFKFRTVERSVAVLPLHNLTGQSENDYFVDGMHDALISELGKISSLRVISRTSTLRYRDSKKLLKEIAAELGVNTIVEGSVIGAGDSVRILVQLINVFPNERHILANEYHDHMQNVLTVHSSAVKDIAKKVNVRLSKKEEQRLKKSRQVNPETYKAYLRGMYYLNQGTDESFEKGIGYLQEAIQKDPADPFAYAGLAVGYAMVGHGQLNSEEAFNCAMSSANKAIKLDPTVDAAYTALSVLYLYDVFDWPLTKNAFENTLSINPNNDVAHAHFAWYYVLFNEMEKSIYHAKKAVELEPFSAAYTSWLALIYFYNKDYKNAEYWAKKALTLKNDAPYANLTLGWIELQKKNYPIAIDYHEKLPVKNFYWRMLCGYAYVKAGQREKALEIWNELIENNTKNPVNVCHLGMMAGYMGFYDQAFELLNEAFEKKLYPITYLNFYLCTQDYRKDPRYIKLLQKMQLPSFEEAQIPGK